MATQQPPQLCYDERVNDALLDALKLRQYRLSCGIYSALCYTVAQAGVFITRVLPSAGIQIPEAQDTACREFCKRHMRARDMVEVVKRIKGSPLAPEALTSVEGFHLRTSGGKVVICSDDHVDSEPTRSLDDCLRYLSPHVALEHISLEGAVALLKFLASKHQPQE